MIRAVAEGESAEAWAEALHADWQSSARPLKREGDTAVLRARLRDREVVVKTWRLAGRLGGRTAGRTAGRSGGRRRVQSMLTLSPAWRHWRAARRLAADGFQVARPLVIATIETDSGPAEALVLEALTGPTALEALTRPAPVPVEAAMATAAGAQIGALARAGWYNRDHKPSNLIVTRAAPQPGRAEIAMIDCVGFRRVKPDSDEYLARMLAKLAIEPLGCNILPRRAIRWRILRAAAGDDPARQRRLWRQVERLIAEHGDPTPKVNPLQESPERKLGESR